MTDSWGFAAPVLPGQEGAATAMAEHLRAHKADWDESHDHASITLERTYLMRTPMGTLLVEYGETKASFGESFGTMLASTTDLDRWFFKALKGVTGIDFTQPPAGPPPELVLSYYHPKPERGRGLAFAAPPLGPGKTDQWLRFSHEATERMSEFSQARQSYGISVDRTYLNRTPMGDILVVYLEGEDPVAGNAAFASSTRPFDIWFREQATGILGIDFTQPLPPIEPLWEWQQSQVTA